MLPAASTACCLGSSAVSLPRSKSSSNPFHSTLVHTNASRLCASFDIAAAGPVVADRVRFGDLTTCRERAAWTQEHLADAASIEVRTVQRAEKGKHISAETLQAIAGAFDMSVDGLRYAVGIRPQPPRHLDGRITAVEAENTTTGEHRSFVGDFFFSTMAVKDLVQAMHPAPPAAVREVGDQLIYRDFLTVGLLCQKLKVRDDHAQSQSLIRDNWIYIQEPEVKVGRLQIFNNWSPYMVSDQSKVWLGLEYFCFEGDELWRMPDDELIRFGAKELAMIDIVDEAEVLDGTVLRMEKTYPAYFGSYDRFPEIRNFVDKFPNLFLVGRNGMHRYNNQDHSMLTAMVAVDNIASGSVDKENVWSVNTEQEYHEEK